MSARFAAYLLAALLLAPGLVHAEEVVATDRSVDLYGYCAALEPGQVVAARTPAGLLCGQCLVRERGAYGFLHVYGDDPATPVVEGAQAGERLTLSVNGVAVETLGPDQPVWTQDGARLQVNLGQAAAPPAEPRLISCDGAPVLIAAAELPARVVGSGELAGVTIDIPVAALGGGADAQGQPLLSLSLSCRLQEAASVPELPPGHFGPVVTLGPDGVRFGEPLTVTVPCGGPLPAHPVMYYRDAAGQWQTEGVTFAGADPQAGTLTFRTTHFSLFAAGSLATTTAEPTAAADGGGGGGCFIATAAFGSPLETHVSVLRRFRDEVLETNSLGQGFVRLYYRHGPPLARYIDVGGDVLRGLTRLSLYPVAALAQVAVQRHLSLGAGVLTLVLAACLLRRHRGRAAAAGSSPAGRGR